MTLEDWFIAKYRKAGAVDEKTLQMFDEDRTFFNTVQFWIDDRKDQKRENKNIVFNALYFVLFDITKHKQVQESPYNFWKPFANLIAEASMYNIHCIILDNTCTYFERQIGGFYMISNADSLSDIPRKWKGVDKNLMKLVDITGEFSALVKLPKNDPEARKKGEEQRTLVSVLEDIKEKMTPEEQEMYTIKI